MKLATMFQTGDGKLHATEGDARRHLDVQIGNVMLPLAKKLAACDKYSQVVDVLDESTEAMRALVALKDELQAGLSTEESD